ncbi:MAG: dihydroorotate dehydrogenase electron transfer subunit [Candidatus Ratteibacteria bacterium]|nr:dihydroorotate dehydrogenase electron transfer subunit [Candidatus Ratteibacteria bacterium]
MKIQSPEIAKDSSPGQFLHIKCSASNHYLLRRPLSIHQVIDGKYVEILYKIVGKGTDWLSKRKRGEKLDCIGPLGNGFRLIKSEIVFVAGGIGIAPLIFLAEKIAKTDRLASITAFIGAKTKDEILCADKLKKLRATVHIATEDGSLGYKGLVSNLFKNNLSSVVCRLSSVIYACGPKGMLKEIALLSQKYKIPCQVSFEQFMGCGIGICNACVIRTKYGYKKVCKDGPVFDTEEIDWSKI